MTESWGHTQTKKKSKTFGHTEGRIAQKCWSADDIVMEMWWRYEWSRFSIWWHDGLPRLPLAVPAVNQRDLPTTTTTTS
jgi:hypothetical protein